MRKILVFTMLISLVVCLSAQKGQQIKPKKQVHQKEKVVHKKMDYELEYNKLNDAYKALADKEKNTNIKWKKLNEKHNKYIKSYKVNQDEVNALKTERERLRNRLQLQINNYNNLKTKNDALQKENNRLRLELENMKPKEKKVKKTVTPSK